MDNKQVKMRELAMWTNLSSRLTVYHDALIKHKHMRMSHMREFPETVRLYRERTARVLLLPLDKREDLEARIKTNDRKIVQMERYIERWRKLSDSNKRRLAK